MRTLPGTLTSHLNSRDGVELQWLIWLQPRNRSTGLIETVGFWSGEETRSFSINGSDRDYIGGALLEIPAIVRSKGLQDRRHSFELAGLNPLVRSALETLEFKRAPFECHRADFDPKTANLVAEPQPELRGLVDTFNSSRDGDGETQSVSLVVTGLMHFLTQSLSLKKSDAAQQLRSAGDRGLKYADVSGKVPVAWGERTIEAESSSPSGGLFGITQPLGGVYGDLFG